MKHNIHGKTTYNGWRKNQSEVMSARIINLTGSPDLTWMLKTIFDAYKTNLLQMVAAYKMYIFYGATLYTISSLYIDQVVSI